jgi:lysophospholipase L1-like esterase
MQRRNALLALWLLAASLLTPLHAQTPAVQTPANFEPNFARWEGAIGKMEQADKVNPPASGGIVFTGSSSIARWTTLATDFPDLPVLNRGFGGSVIAEVTHFADRIVIPYKPRLVVFYAGDNDLGFGRTPQEVLGDFQQFVATVRKGLPQAKIAFISIKPSILRKNMLEQMRASNALIKSWLQKQKNVAYIDVFTPMLDDQGQIRADLFVADNLHMNRTGYDIWTRVVGPYLK